MSEEALLSGVRVLDFTFQGAGPYATMLLGALGADVIKVESSRRPDPTRGRENRPYLRSLLYDDVNLGKRCINIDMKTDDGRGIARELADHCDAVVDNFRPGVMTRWGLDYASLSATHPRIVSASLSAMGSQGPLSTLPGYAGIFNALSGLGGLVGYDDGPPTELRTSVDMRAGAFFGFAIVQGLLAASRYGVGCYVDTSATECITALSGEFLAAYLLVGEEPERVGNADSNEWAHGVFRSADSKWVVVSVPSDVEWRRLGLVSGSEVTSAPGPQNAEAIQDWLTGIPAATAITRLHEAGIAAACVQDAPTLFTDPQLAFRGFFEELPPRPNGERRMAAAAPWLVDGRRPPVHAGPDLGQDTTDVLRRVLGLTDKRITDLTASGALA